MSNSYTKAAFSLAVTPGEAEMLARVVAAVDLIARGDVGLEALEVRYAQLGPDFATLFPRSELSPFDGLLDLVPDLHFLELGFDLEIGEPDANGQVPLFFSSAL